MGDSDRLQRALHLAKIATERDAAGDFEVALDYYRASLENWQFVCKYQPNAELKAKLLQKMEPYISRAEVLKECLQHKISPAVPPAGTPSAKPVAQAAPPAPAPRNIISPNTNRQSKQRTKSPVDEDTARLNALISASAITKIAPVHWDDVAGLESAKTALQEAMVLPVRFPTLFKGERRPWKGILLYGPPGTGKTHLARACACECECTFLSVTSSDLLSKWQGESEKTVKVLFELARTKAPTVIFIDEIDSLCCSRSDRENESSRRIKTEFLVQMDGVKDDSDKQVLVLGATNTPWELDAAIRRRFERRIYIPLPDKAARLKLFQLHTGQTPHQLTLADWEELAQRTEGFSAADISITVRDALFAPVRRCQTATHFKRAGIGMGYLPCDPNDPDPTKEKRGILTIPNDQLLTLPVVKEDFLCALNKSKPSVAKCDLDRYMKWTQQFGIEGN